MQSLPNFSAAEPSPEADILGTEVHTVQKVGVVVWAGKDWAYIQFVWAVDSQSVQVDCNRLVREACIGFAVVRGQPVHIETVGWARWADMLYVEQLAGQDCMPVGFV